MTLCPNAQFRSAFPDDSDDDLELQPGRNIVEALSAGLVRSGYRVSEPISGGDHGWELDIWRGRKRLWLQVSVLAADECYLMAENMTFWLWPDVKLFRAFLADLERILADDSRFGVIGWFRSSPFSGETDLADTPFQV